MPQGKKFADGVRAGIALACLGSALALASTVVPKTPAENIFWFLMIFILSAGAVLAFIGFIRNKKAKAIVGFGLSAVMAVLCAAKARQVWPDTEPTSDIAVETFQFLPFVIDAPPRLNVGLFNSGPHTIKAFQVRYVGVAGGPFVSFQQHTYSEEDWWNRLAKLAM